MKYIVVCVLSVFLLFACTANRASQKQSTSSNSLSLDDVSSLKIATSKGKSYANAQAAQGCGRYKKSPKFTGAKPNYNNTATVYSYDCK